MRSRQIAKYEAGFFLAVPQSMSHRSVARALTIAALVLPGCVSAEEEIGLSASSLDSTEEIAPFRLTLLGTTASTIVFRAGPTRASNPATLIVESLGSGAAPSHAEGGKRWTASNYRFDLGGLPGRVSKVDAFVVKQDAIDYRATVQSTNAVTKLTISLAGDTSQWEAWFAEGTKKDGRITYVDDVGDELVTLTLHGVTPSHLVRSSTTRADGPPTLTGILYIEQVDLRAAGGEDI